MTTGQSCPGQLDDLGADRAVGLDDAAGVVTAEHVGAGIGRVGQDPQHPGMGEPAPAQLAGPHAAVGPQREPAAPEGGHHLVGRTAGAEGGEQVGHRGLHFGVGVDHRGALVVVDKADRQRETQLATLGRRPLGPLEAAGQEVELCFVTWCLSGPGAAGR